jgi:hypothetical protein
MSTREVTPDQILQELRGLQPDRWSQVLDFIGYLRSAPPRDESHRQELTARALLESGLVGIWAGREDIEDSPSFARRLRREAEHRQRSDDDPA